VLCRGAPKAPYPGSGSVLTRPAAGLPHPRSGVWLSSATARRLCRLTGVDPRSGVRGQRRAVCQPPRGPSPQALLGRGERWGEGA
jgi:hypothetical protein